MNKNINPWDGRRGEGRNFSAGRPTDRPVRAVSYRARSFLAGVELYHAERRGGSFNCAWATFSITADFPIGPVGIGRFKNSIGRKFKKILFLNFLKLFWKKVPLQFFFNLTFSNKTLKKTHRFIQRSILLPPHSPADHSDEGETINWQLCVCSPAEVKAVAVAESANSLIQQPFADKAPECRPDCSGVTVAAKSLKIMESGFWASW